MYFLENITRSIAQNLSSYFIIIIISPTSSSVICSMTDYVSHDQYCLTPVHLNMLSLLLRMYSTLLFTRLASFHSLGHRVNAPFSKKLPLDAWSNVVSLFLLLSVYFLHGTYLSFVSNYLLIYLPFIPH